ncbi:hypothetical protein B0H13DRAFT_1095075 [Mycena leptocephala]|nr:hypothetical protein B0H13DRAFT_1095075 [Mycena leptocephala]
MEPMPIDLQVVFYIKAGFLALLVYDSLLQINEEYLHVWKSRWTLIKCLYLWTRYIATFTTAFSGFIIGVTELILMVRTYTLYERSKKLLAFFFVLWFSVGGVASWAVAEWTTSPSFKCGHFVYALGLNSCSLSLGFGVLSCWFSDAGRIGIGLVCYLSLLAGETVIVLLTLGKVFHEFYRHKSGLLKSLYCDGVWFYLAIWPSCIVTVLVLYFAPPGLNNLPDIPVLVMHSVLSCRLITHAREIAAEEDRRAYAVNKIFKERYLISDAVVDISPV